MSRYITIFPSASRTTAQTSSDITNTTEIGVDIVLDLTVLGTSLQITVEGLDPASGKWYEIVQNAFSNQVEVRTIRIHPALTVDTGDVDNLYISATLPETWRVRVDVSSATVTTYSIGAFVY